MMTDGNLRYCFERRGGGDRLQSAQDAGANEGIPTDGRLRLLRTD